MSPPIITGSYSDQMEFLRRSIEVLFGERAELLNIDFVKRTATFKYGTECANIKFQFTPGLGADIYIYGISYLSRGQTYQEVVRVSNMDFPEADRTNTYRMCWAGSSFVDRKWEPEHIDTIESKAKKLGVGLSEMLTGYKVT